jgi:hypothetical protein
VKLSRVPELVRALSLQERRLAWGVTTEELPLVATASALHIGEQVLPWTQVERISWKPSVLTVVEAAEVEGTGRTRSWELATDARLAEIIRASVTSSVGWTDRRALPSGGHVRLVGRRTPGQDALQWQCVWDRPGRPDADLVQRWIDELRATIG